MEFYKKYKKFDIFFTIVFILNIVFLHYLTDYRMVAKPMIMASLMGFYIMNAKIQSPLVILAIIAALFGDIFLLFNSEVFFLMGLGSFAIMQILYTITFLQKLNFNIPKKKYIIILSVSLAGIGLFLFLKPYLGGLLFHVLIYTLLIVLMTISAILRKESLHLYKWVIFGAILFMVSDALIAIGKFITPITAHQELVMGTYMLAQLFIIKGIVAQDKEIAK